MLKQVQHDGGKAVTIEPLADIAHWNDHRHMIDQQDLSQPHVRNELKVYLSELQAEDPRPFWRAERERGLASGIDQVFHFFFDDHEFDETAIGAALIDRREVGMVEALKDALSTVLGAVGDADDDSFVSHPLWLDVKRTATAANSELV